MAKKKDYFIVELKLLTSSNQLSVLDKRFQIAESIYNKTLAYSLKQLKRMKENKAYKDTLKAYLEFKRLEDVDNTKLYSGLLNTIRESYSLSEYSLHKFVKVQQNMYKGHIDSHTAQKIASTVWIAISDVLFKKGNKAHFKKFGTLTSVEGKTNNSGIRFKDNKLFWIKEVIPVKIRLNDLFIQEALLSKVKYCRIIRKSFKSGYKYFLQLVIEGNPPVKRINSTGDFRHNKQSNDRVGLDIGTSTIAISSKNMVDLIELAPKSNIYTKDINNLKRKLQRSRMATNPNNFNPNGTIKKGVKLKWVRSNNYMKILFKLKNAYRLKSNYIKLSHNILSNKILTYGNQVYVERMSFAGLSKRAKKTTINTKTGKINKKKRFGKSLNNKAPAMLISIIDRKLNYNKLKINKVNTWTFKASQYNHVTNKYVKKKLSKRWNTIDNKRVQRDLYSAFLLMNSKESLQKTDRALCIKTYDDFIVNHDKCINSIIDNNDLKIISSFGIKR